MPEATWWRTLADDALEFLYIEGRQRLRETLDARDGQDRTALYLTSWTVTIVGAAGIFGDLRITDRDAVSALSIVAAISAVAAGLIAAWLFQPRSWFDGADVEWLSDYQGASRRELMGEALDAIVGGFGSNVKTLRFRHRLMGWLYATTASTSVLVVSIQIVSATAATDLS